MLTQIFLQYLNLGMVEGWVVDIEVDAEFSGLGAFEQGTAQVGIFKGYAFAVFR